MVMVFVLLLLLGSKLSVRDKFLHGCCTSGTRIWGRILRNEFWTPEFWTRILGSNFLILVFPAKEAPLKIHPPEIHLPKFTFRNSTQKYAKNIHIAPLQGRLADFQRTMTACVASLLCCEAILVMVIFSFSIGPCPLVLQKLVPCVPFLHRWQGAGGSRSKNLLEGVMKEILVQGHTLRLLDEVPEPRISNIRNQKTRTVSICLINPGGLP